MFALARATSVCALVIELSTIGDVYLRSSSQPMNMRIERNEEIAWEEDVEAKSTATAALPDEVCFGTVRRPASQTSPR